MLHVGIVSGPSDLTQISSAINHDQHPVMKPISVQERLLSMDVLRGVAILGILTVNVYLYGHPYLLDYVGYLKLIGEDPQSRAFDRFSYTMINFLFQESLYCLFAFLLLGWPP